MVNAVFASVVLLVIDRRVQVAVALTLAVLGSIVLGADVTEARPIVATGGHP